MPKRKPENKIFASKIHINKKGFAEWNSREREKELGALRIDERRSLLFWGWHCEGKGKWNEMKEKGAQQKFWTCSIPLFTPLFIPCLVLSQKDKESFPQISFRLSRPYSQVSKVLILRMGDCLNTLLADSLGRMWGILAVGSVSSLPIYWNLIWSEFDFDSPPRLVFCFFRLLARPLRGILNLSKEFVPFLLSFYSEIGLND